MIALPGSIRTVFLPSVLCCLCCLWPADRAFGEARSVEEFVAQQDNWRKLTGTTWTIEGRFTVLGTNNLKFVYCDLPFILPEGLARQSTQSNVVEVTGSLVQERTQLVFHVTSLKARPTDLEMVRLKRATVDPRVPKHWYAVAEWALGRARFYKDDELMSEALILFGEAIGADRRLLAADDYKGLLALAARAAELNVDPRLVDQLRHEGLRRQFEHLQAQPNFDLTLLLADIPRLLKGASQRLANPDDPLIATYLQDPLKAYHEATGDDRIRLQRIFYIDVSRAQYKQRLDPEGRNGFEIARQVDVQTPELSSLADAFRDQQQQWQLAHIHTMTRQELFEFDQVCTSRKQIELGREAKIKWLQAREPRLRADGARGLAELGEDWWSLLEDEEGASRYFIAAYNANPEYAPAATWLTMHGFVYQRGKWIKAARAEELLNAKDIAIRDGRVEIGMTEAEVRATLGAGPTSTLRMASSGRIVDLWVFEQAGIIVRFDRPAKDPAGHVVAIDQIDNAPRGPKRPQRK